MDLRTIYITNGVGICILLMLYYTSRVKIYRRNTEDRLYAFLVFGVMLGCFMEALSYTLDGKVFPGSILINHIANTYLFTINLLLPFCVLVYADFGLYGDLRRIPRKYKPQIAVGALLIVANVVNLFYPITYYLSPGNVYERRPLSYVYYFVILFYCLTAYFVTRRYEKENGAKAFFRIDMFLLPILVGSALQFLFYGLSLAWLAAAVGLVGLFMMQQNEMAYVDSLVGTYNRQYFSHILTTWIGHGREFAGVMLDIDSFKSINDGFGHSEGDKALKTLTDILKSAARDREWVFRFAGDEFIVLKLTPEPDGLVAYMREVERLLAEYNREEHPYPISISYGMSFFDSGDMDSFMKEMDERLYEMKAAHHGHAEAEA